MDDRKKFQIDLHRKLVGYYVKRHSSTIAIRYHEYWNGEILELLRKANPDGKTALDLGAGTGVLSEFMEKAGLTVFSSDISFDMLSGSIDGSVRMRRAVQADGEDLPFSSGRFDYVALRGVLHHVPQPSHLLKEVCRILKPGGALCFSEPCSDGIMLRFVRSFFVKFSSRLGKDHRAFKTTELEKLIENTGFEKAESKKFGFIAFPLCGMTDYLPILTRFPFQSAIFRLLNRLDEIIAGIPVLRRESWGVTMSALKPAEGIDRRFELDEKIGEVRARKELSCV